MSDISAERADKIMRSVGYFKWMVIKEGTIDEERVYSKIDPKYDEVWPIVFVRLSSSSFNFKYHNVNSLFTISSPNYFSPITSKQHFMNMFDKFKKEITYYAGQFENNRNMETDV